MRRSNKELREQLNAYGEYSRRLGTLMASERKLLKRKEHLVNMEEPILILERKNGDIEYYDNVKGDEFLIPGLEAGIEKKILLGRKFQKDLPYAGKTFKAYWAHEDWLFPHQWSQPNTYQGDREDAPNNGWILESANINSEVFRDRERKVLNAWEKFQAKEGKWDLEGIAKIVLYIAGGIALVLFVMNYFGSDPVSTVQAVTQTVTPQDTGVIIG